MGNNKAFTLAEVLITLGIIGLVAAMTMPGLIAKHRKKVVITRMMKFYTVMSEACRLSVVRNTQEGFLNSLDELRIDSSSDDIYKWYKENFSPVVKDIKVTKIRDGILVGLADGSGFILIYGGHMAFCPVYQKCVDGINKYGTGMTLYTTGMDGKDIFGFLLGGNKLFKTYDVCWDGSREGAIKSVASSCPWGDGGQYGCADKHKLCAKLIELDGWQIKDDYPVKF